MSTTAEYRRYGVWLYDARVGTLHQHGDRTRFTFTDEYLADPDRPVLGLFFEQNPHAEQASSLRLSPWFSNLLSEGRLREWIAIDSEVSADREMELLAHVGHDLPGAVRILPDDAARTVPAVSGVRPDGWRFSLAGVGMKFSVVQLGDRLVLPAGGDGGDWIVKLPDQVYPDVPQNEHAVMSLAAAAGIEVPEIGLVHRDQIEGLPPNLWPGHAEWAFAIRRFDRDESRCTAGTTSPHYASSPAVWRSMCWCQTGTHI